MATIRAGKRLVPNTSKIWTTDYGVYPVVAVLGFGVTWGSWNMYHHLTLNPDVVVDKTKRSALRAEESGQKEWKRQMNKWLLADKQDLGRMHMIGSGHTSQLKYKGTQRD